MQIRKKSMITLIISSLCTLCLNLFLLFLFVSPAKRPGDTSPDLAEELQDEPVPISMSEQGNDALKDNEEDGQNAVISTDTGLTAYSEIYVRDIPIVLDEEMDLHLAEFRNKAKLLQQSYPESFLIAMPTEEKTVALTFDDGPDNSSTLKVIEILNSYQIPATFFFVGQQMNRFTEAIEAASAGGHAIANHSWSHIRPTDASVEALMDEVIKTQEALEDFGAGSKLFRPPYGLVNEEQMPALIQAGYKTVAWSIDSMDWYFDNPDDIVKCVTENIHPGAIVLMHSSGGPDNRQATISALPAIIETLQEQGYRFVSLP